MSKAIVPRAPFDTARAREVIAKAGYELEVVAPLPDEEHGSFQTRVSKPDEKPLVVVEWHVELEKWLVYVDDGDGILTNEVAKSFGSNVKRAAHLSDTLNEADSRLARKRDAGETYLIPCTEVHCADFGVGHENLVSMAWDESVVHVRPVNPDTNWRITLNRAADQTEWTAEIEGGHDMSVAEINELVVRLLVARADLVAINASIE